MAFTFEDLRELAEGGSITVADWNRARQNFQAIIAGDEQVGDAGTLDGAAKSTDGTFADNSDAKLPTEKAVKTYVSNNTVSADDYSCLFYPSYENLTAKPNTSNPNYQVDIAWDELRIENRRTTSQSFTVDITASGALGLDTGSEAVSTWYYIWAICNDAGTTVSVILSASATAPTLPSGYTKKRRIGAVYNMSGGHFRGFLQQNNFYNYTSRQIILESGTASTETEINTTSYIPEIAHLVNIGAYQSSYNGLSEYPQTLLYIYGYVNGAYCQQAWGLAREFTNGVRGMSYITCSITTFNRRLQYKSTSDCSVVKYTTIDLFGFELNI